MAAGVELNRIVTELLSNLRVAPIHMAGFGLPRHAANTRLDANLHAVEESRLKTLETEEKILERQSRLRNFRNVESGYSIMNMYPGRFSSSTQAKSWSDALRKITESPIDSMRRKNKELFGTFGDDYLYTRMIDTKHQRAIDDLYKSKKQKRIDYLLDNVYGNTGTGLLYAEDQVRREDSLERDATRRRGYRTADASRARQAFSYKHDIEWSDYDRDLFAAKKQYGARRGEDALRNILNKELGPFFKNSRMSTRDLHRIVSAKNIIGKIPIIGGLATNPAALGVSAAVGMWRTMFSALSDQFSSSKRVVERLNKVGFYGTPGSKNLNALIASGESIGSASQTIGSATARLSAMKYGRGLESIEDLAMFSRGDPRLGGLVQSMMQGDYTSSRKIAYDIAQTLPEGERINFLNAAGISEKEYNAEKIKRGGMLTRQEKLNIAKEQTSAYLDDLESSSPLAAISLGMFDGLIKAITIGRSDLETMLASSVANSMKSANVIAEQDLSYQQSRAANPSYYDYVTNNNSGRTTTIHIDTAQFNGINDVNGMKREVGSMADKEEEFHSTAEANDPKVF